MRLYEKAGMEGPYKSMFEPSTEPNELPRAAWRADTNMVSDEYENAGKTDAVTSTGNFKEDYLAYCNHLGVIPHPAIAPFFVKADTDEDTDVQDTVYDMSEVTSVILKGWEVDSGTLKAVCLALPQCPNITSITLSDAKLDSKQITSLAESLPQMPHVTTLHLEWNPLSESEDNSCFARLLERTSPLTSLSLRGNKLSDNGAAHVAKVLRSSNRLTYLNLFANSIGDSGAIAVGKALRYNCSLETLSLANNDLTSKSLFTYGQTLTCYELEDTDRDERIEVEAELAEAKKALEESGKKKGKKGKKGGEAAPAIVVGELPTLEEVDGRSIAKGNRKLEILNLSSNQIDNEGASQFSSALLDHLQDVQDTLHAVYLHRNQVSADVAKTIKEKFRSNEEVKLSITL